LLVFLTFISLIVNQYVPVWMKDSEASHMGNAFGQFGSLKGSVDLQMLAAQMAANAGVDYIPISSFTPVTLGVEGIPIFTSATLGVLEANTTQRPFSTQFHYLIGSTVQVVNVRSTGAVALEAFNRYYLHGSLTYENGAVIRAQVDGQAVRADPTFDVAIVGSRLQQVTIVTPYYRIEAAWKEPKQAYDVIVRIYNDPNGTIPLVMPIDIVRVQQAFVNVAVAEQGSTVEI